MKPKTQKQVETEKWVDAYIKKNNFPPTYKQVREHFKIDNSAAHSRCRNFRDKMKKNLMAPPKHKFYSRVTISFMVETSKEEKFYELIKQVHKSLES